MRSIDVFVGAGRSVAVAGADSVGGGRGVGLRGCCIHATHKNIRAKSRIICNPFPQMFFDRCFFTNTGLDFIPHAPLRITNSGSVHYMRAWIRLEQMAHYV